MNEADLRPNPYQRILFCTDFSENADLAFDIALDSAIRRPGCTLYLLHVIPAADAQFWNTYLYEADNVDGKGKADIEARIAERYRPRVPEGVNVVVETRTGTDYEEILAFAREKDMDLIVIGRQGRSQLSKVLFGNVTERIARKADCPVLIIPLSFARKRKRG